MPRITVVIACAVNSKQQLSPKFWFDKIFTSISHSFFFPIVFVCQIYDFANIWFGFLFDLCVLDLPCGLQEFFQGFSHIGCLSKGVGCLSNLENRKYHTCVNNFNWIIISQVKCEQHRKKQVSKKTQRTYINPHFFSALKKKRKQKATWRTLNERTPTLLTTTLNDGRSSV